MKPSRLIFLGAVISVASIVLMKARFDEGVFRNVLHGADILDTGVEARWPLLLGLVLVCWGIFRRLEEK